MAIKESVSVAEAIAFLNSLLELDRPAVASLIANRVPCNQALADHETVQVRAQHGGYHVGLLGILNGLFGCDDDGIGPIAAVFDQDGSLQCFSKPGAAWTPGA
jgi:hypothetical protein